MDETVAIQEKIKENKIAADFWRTEFQKFSESGLNQAEYCRQEGLSYSVFCYWKKRVFKPSFPEAQKKFSDVSSRLSEIRVFPGSRCIPYPLRVWLGDICIEVSENFSKEALREVIKTLRSV